MSDEFRRASFACSLTLICVGFVAAVIFGNNDIGIALPIGAMIMWLGE